MTMLTALKQLLVSDATVNGIVQGRISPGKGSQGTTYPDITYRVMNDESVMSQDGRSGLSYPKVELMLHARKYSDLDALRIAVKNRLTGYRGVQADENGDPTDFQAIFLDTGYDLPYDHESQLYSCSLTFDVWHEEPQG